LKEHAEFLQLQSFIDDAILDFLKDKLSLPDLLSISVKLKEKNKETIDEIIRIENVKKK